MLRFLVGLTLLVFAIALPLLAPARGEPPTADNGLPDLRQQLEEFLHPTEETERQRRRLTQNVMERDRVYEKIRSLVEGGPTFVFEDVDGLRPLQRVRAACLVGETGKRYTYDFKMDGAEGPGVIDGHEFSKAVDLAKSLEHVEWSSVPARTLEHVADIRELAWYVFLDGKSTLLQIRGDYVGAHPNPHAAELVKLINGWCPYAAEIRSRPELPSFEARPRPPY